ncbi:MAG: IreB family regulatory phosphoprotein [Clostridiales bacterium]|nr:IreB family regulatory phosphoprotein [Clostridiales bacterium]
MNDISKTQRFKLGEEREDIMKDTLVQIFDALQEKGYNPINQIVGYILSEDPTYITTHNNARSLIRRIDRDELLSAMVKSYLNS